MQILLQKGAEDKWIDVVVTDSWEVQYSTLCVIGLCGDP